MTYPLFSLFAPRLSALLPALGLWKRRSDIFHARTFRA